MTRSSADFLHINYNLLGPLVLAMNITLHLLWGNVGVTLRQLPAAQNDGCEYLLRQDILDTL